jgi:hypothetical protein
MKDQVRYHKQMKLLCFRAIAFTLLSSFFAFAAGISNKKTDEDYRAAIANWREERQAKLRTDDGWLTLAGLFWLNPGENTFGSAQSNDIVLPQSAPQSAGNFVLKQGKVSLNVDPKVQVTLNGQRIKVQVTLNGQRIKVAELHTDAPGSTPDKVQLGSLTMTIISRGDKLGVRVKDKNSKARRDFKGLSYYPIDPKLRIVADFIPYTPPKKIPIPTVLGTTVREPSPGRAEFTLDGKKITLEPVIEDADTLFFIFKDTTAGSETYGAGRFLYTPNPRDGKVVLDFNKAENPPCAFTPYATCPLPPPQNKLAIPIRAGEKKYDNH